MNEKTVICRLLPLETHDGPLNMAIDEALLTSCEAGGAPLTLRLYAWAAPTLSLGYFQDAAAAGPRLGGLPVVRRLTGGGAIVHDAELTYSLTWRLSQETGIPRSASGSYAHFNRALAAALRNLGVAPDSPAEGDASRAFLCFERRSRYDILVRGHKVVGSAQRRRPGAALQHGSILLGKSAARGVRDLSLSQLVGRAIRMEEAAGAVGGAFESELGWTFESARLTADEHRIAQELRTDKYSHVAWGGRRSPHRSKAD